MTKSIFCRRNLAPLQGAIFFLIPSGGLRPPATLFQPFGLKLRGFSLATTGRQWNFLLGTGRLFRSRYDGRRLSLISILVLS